MAGTSRGPPEQLLCAVVVVAQQQLQLLQAAAPPGGAGPAPGLDTAQLVLGVWQQPGCSNLEEEHIKGALQYAYEQGWVHAATPGASHVLRSITATVRPHLWDLWRR
jgi:hypothetical protein